MNDLLAVVLKLGLVTKNVLLYLYKISEHQYNDQNINALGKKEKKIHGLWQW